MKRKDWKFNLILVLALVLLLSLTGVTMVSATGAIRPGFDNAQLAANDDGYTGLVPIGFSADFFGTTYTNLYVNNNGNVTFDVPMATYTPFNLLTTGRVVIAPFFADVDTRVGNVVGYGQGTVDGHPAFGVTWPGVRCFAADLTETAGLNYFQVVLIDRSDIGPGDFDIEFNYESIDWETGRASGGNSLCEGGNSVRVGFTNGTTFAYELPGSGVVGAFLDTNTDTGLIHNNLNSDVMGRYVWSVRNGIVLVNQPPTADPGGPYTGNEGSPIGFDGSGSSDPDGDALTYDWDFGDGTVELDAGSTPIHTYDDNGEYTVCLTVTDPDGLSDMKCTTHTYELVYEGLGISWEDAKVAAEARNDDNCTAHLVTITSQQEQDELIALFGGGLIGRWYGGYQSLDATNPDEGWQWVTEEPWVYENWASGEPNDYPTTDEDHQEDYLMGWSNNEWNDGSGVTSGYVVEYECSATVTINNVAPQLQNVAVTSSIFEGEYATLAGEIIDPGALDTFTFDVDWGDGSSDSYFYTAGTTIFSETHQYLDDDPSGTPSDEYAISLTLTDDDGGIASGGSGNVPAYFPFGPQANVPENDLNGWVPCWSSLYGSGGHDIDEVLEECSGEFLLLGGRPVGSAVFDVVAAGRREDVLFDTGTGNTPHNANGVGWYFSPNYSWGFAKEGDAIVRSSCDFADLYHGGANGDLRLCWHTWSNAIQEGWRSGTNVWLNLSNTFERFIFQASPAPLSITVINVPPTVDAGPDQTIDEGSIASIAATYSDVGTLDTHSATIEWGDGSSVESAAASSGAVSGSHLYEDDGTYTVEVCVTDDDTAETCDMLDFTVDNVAPVVEASSSSQTVQYSDYITPVTFTATDIAVDTMSAVTSTLPDTLTFALDGCVISINTNTCTWTLSGTMDVPDGNYPVTVTVTDDEGGSSEITHTITVIHENADIWLDSNNMVDLEVDTPGGDSPAFSLTAYVKETVPDAASGSPDPGDISNAVVEMTLAAVGPGNSYTVLCTPVVVSGTGYDAVLEVRCDFDDVEVNTYHVIANVVGNYYSGGPDESVLVVYDPSLGFTTGGGWFYWPGTDQKTNFGYVMKYNKKGTNVKGSLLIIRHVAPGEKYRIKSNALDGLALGDGGGFGWASFSGKATYLEPGWPEPIGNHSFVVYVEDHGQSGDQFWIEVHDKDGNVIAEMSLEREATEHHESIEGGNIVVPH